jgi:hypothetical protein
MIDLFMREFGTRADGSSEDYVTIMQHVLFADDDPLRERHERHDRARP